MIDTCASPAMALTYVLHRPEPRRPLPGAKAASGVRGHSVRHQAGRDVAVSGQPDRAAGDGMPVQQRAEAGGRWVVLAGDAGGAGAHRGGGCALDGGRDGLACGCGQDQVLSFRTNVDQVVAAGAGAPDPGAVWTRGDGGADPLHPGAGGAEGGAADGGADFSRAVYYELVALSVPCQLGGRERAGRLEPEPVLLAGRGADARMCRRSARRLPRRLEV